MAHIGKKLGILISAAPDQANFTHGVRLADAALSAGIQVYVYCIDDAVPGVHDLSLQALKQKGVILYACAYGAHKRNLPLSEAATFAGLTVVNDLMASTDRFVSFN